MPSILEGDGSAPGPIEDATPSPAELGPPAVSTAAEIFNWIKAALLSKSILAADEAELVSFVVIATWLQESLSVPCHTITGSVHEAMRVMRLLNLLRAGAGTGPAVQLP